MKRGGILCILVLAVALFFLAVPYAANAATFNCTIRTSSCNANETPLVYLNSSESGNAPNNSHAMLANYSGALYPYVVCCWTDAFRTLSNTCGGNGIAVLRLNQTTDSHVEAGNMTTAIYPFKACLNVTSGNITCEYPTSTCSAGYSPVLSIASSDTGDGNLTNAHIGDYALYNRKTCCAVGGQNPPTIAYTNISPNGTATTRQDLECQNGSVTDADGDTVTLHYNWYLNDTSATLLNLPMDYDSNTGTTHDISGYANHGTISSEIDFYPISGYIGGGFSIGALAGFIIIPASPVFNFSTNDFSYAVWTNYSSLASLILFDTRNSSGNGFALIISGNTVKCLISNGTIVQTSTLGTSGANAWHHYICVRNSTALTLFKDGALFKTVSTTNVNVNTSSENLTFSFGTNTEDSFIDEVMIFNRSLTPSEIQALYATNNRWFNSTELRRGNGWNCSITPIDSTGLNGSTKYSNRTIINGSAPLNVSLLYPLNNNQSVFERNVNFSWSTADERDGDTVTYNLSANVTPGLCGAQVAVNPTTTNYTSSELCVDQLYNWTVRACDVDGCSAWAPQYNFTIASVVSIILRANNTDFGTLNLGQSKDTVTGGVSPFVLENNGNVLVNITILGNNSPFTSVNLNSTAFQYKARANETGAFPAGTAQMTYTPVNSTTTNLVKQFNYTDVSDDLLVDINITVPFDEGAGTKSANITFTAGRWNST